MMTDTARIAHARSTDDDLGFLVRIDGFGFIRRNGQAQVLKTDGVDALTDQSHGLLVKAVLLGLHEDLCSGDGQGGIHVDRKIRKFRDHIILLDLADVVKKDLGASHRKGRNDQVAALGQGIRNEICQLRHRIGVADLVQAVTVGGFHNHIVRFLCIFGIPQKGLVLVAYVTGENDLFCDSSLGQPQLNAGGPQKMAYVCQAEFHAFTELIDPVVAVGAEQFDHHHGIFHGVDRLYFRTGPAVPDPLILILCFTGLDMGRVTEHDIRKKGCSLGRYDVPSETVVVKLWQHTGMIDMGMGQKNIVYFGRRNRHGFVLIGISALLHSAVDEDMPASHLNIVAASCNFMICTDKLQLHMVPPMYVASGSGPLSGTDCNKGARTASLPTCRKEISGSGKGSAGGPDKKYRRNIWTVFPCFHYSTE